MQRLAEREPLAIDLEARRFRVAKESCPSSLAARMQHCT
jgi:hypothetical protein